MEQQDVVLAIEAEVNQLSVGVQAQVQECEHRLNSLVKRYGDAGVIALSLLGAKYAAASEQEGR